MATIASVDHRNRRVGLLALAFALLMLGMGFAAVPLYRMFCQATGFNGTPVRATEAQAARIGAVADTITIRFDGNVERGLPWQFRPLRTTDTVQLGGRHMAQFVARNVSNHAITGRASYNIEPEQAARYFNKIQCFCFTEQTLQPGQEVQMPVVYFVDPKIKDDPDARDVGEITLSYTFHEATDRGAKPLDHGRTAG